jgi:hypothetical protein
MYHRNQRRTDILDTSDWAHRELVARLRKLSPEERLRMLFQAIQFGFSLEIAGRALREGRDSRTSH